MKNSNYFFVLFLLLGFTANAQWQQIGEDIDGENEYDLCGSSVSINSNGTVVAIGAFANNGNGSESGHVRIFQLQSNNWIQVGNDIDGEDSEDRSGGSVCLSAEGSIVAIGAHWNDGNGENAGHVRVFQNISNNWIQIGEDIDGENPGDYCGMTLSLSADGTTVAISSVESDEIGSNSGHVRIFMNQDNNWIQIGNNIVGEAAGDEFGTSLCLNGDGTIVVIGSTLNDGNGINSGHVRVFKNQESEWIQIGNDLDGDFANEYFGSSVSINNEGDIVAVGSKGYDGNGNDFGRVQVYKNIEEYWVQIGSDVIGEAENDQFGYSVSLNSDGSILAAGARFNDDNGADSGHVQTYQNIDNNWIQLGVNIVGEAADDWFGASLQLSSDGMTLVVGGLFNDGNGENAGYAQVYEQTNTNLQIAQLQHSVLIYPNPTEGLISIKSDLIKFKNIILSDLTGRKIHNIKFSFCNNAIIDVSDLKKGVYIITIEFGDNYVTKQIVVQ